MNSKEIGYFIVIVKCMSYVGKVWCQNFIYWIFLQFILKWDLFL